MVQVTILRAKTLITHYSRADNSTCTSFNNRNDYVWADGEEGN